MTRHDSKDVITAFGRLTDAAEDYVNRAPMVRRIQDQRTALLEAIGDAQLVLSVHGLPPEPAGEYSHAVEETLEAHTSSVTRT